jgi:hypothetical protein
MPLHFGNHDLIIALTLGNEVDDAVGIFIFGIVIACIGGVGGRSGRGGIGGAGGFSSTGDKHSDTKQKCENRD